MKLLLWSLAAVALLGACATETDTLAQERPNCRNVDPPTGSRLVRRMDCAEAMEYDRLRAQQDTRQLQDLQQQITPTLLK